MDATFVRDALLRKNYFPNHRTKSSELPPCFTTEALDAVSASQIATTKPFQGGENGCDFVPYTLTRFNGGPRLCGLPHPYTHCRLVDVIYNHWNKIEPLIQSDSSQITAHPHKDGRLFIMDYETQFSRSRKYLNKQSGMKYVAKADISHFYPSIYTHAISWAAVGIDTAKSKQKQGNLWHNKLDARVRDCKRNETNGIIVGPGSSSLVSEIILCEVDRRLEKEGFKFLRFIDDYTCFALDRAEANRFIKNLEIQLSRYSLFLNFGKTTISDLTGSELPEWIPALQSDALGRDPNFFSLKLYFSRAVSIAQKYPEGSVLRYAIHALLNRSLNKRSGEYVLRTVLALSLHHPHLISALSGFLHFGYNNGIFSYQSELCSLLDSAVETRRSDAMCWALYLICMIGDKAPASLAERVLKTFDPCAITVLYEAGDSITRRMITRYVKKRILDRDRSAIERNWILVHYLLNEKRLKPSEVSDLTLRKLQSLKLNLYSF